MRIARAKTEMKFIRFDGGLDLTTPAMEAAPGGLRAGSNIEIGVNGGYAPIAGYERYSGKAKPSSATYSRLTCSVTGVAVGDVLTDNAGTSFGTVIALENGAVVLTLITGTFSTGNVKVGASVVGTCTGAQSAGGAATAKLDATYTNLAADVYRALIAVVPGSGGVLGVHQYNGMVYAWRNNAGGTAAVMHVKSASGWAEVALFNEVSFTAGSGAATIVDGGTLTKGGVTALIKRVVVQSGSLTAGTAVGRLIIANPTGGNFSAGAATVGAGTLTLGGAQTTISFAPSGRFEFDNFNFGGSAGTRRMYGADGVNRAFEFDGTTLVPIATGMTTDTPKFIKAHKNQLFLSFGSSVQHSAIGTPYIWSAVVGAAELGCGDTVTGFIGLPGTETAGALGIKTANRTLILYGNDVSDWNLVPYSEESGAAAYTNQFINQGVCLDSQGIVLLETTQNYGNFQDAVISDKITPVLSGFLSLATASCIARKKNQYRIFFSGGAGFYLTFKNRKLRGITQIDLPITVSCISSLEGSSGTEEIYFGSTDGFVYQMDIGTSFDGNPISWSATLAFNHLGSPRALKSFRKATTEVQGEGYAEFSFSYVLGYGSQDFSTAPTTTNVSELSGAVNWDSFIWDQFTWDGVSLSPNESDVAGDAENISIMYSGSSDEFPQFTLSGGILQYTPRRQLR